MHNRTLLRLALAAEFASVQSFAFATGGAMEIRDNPGTEGMEVLVAGERRAWVSWELLGWLEGLRRAVGGSPFPPRTLNSSARS
jgi:hypothetical protein